MSDTFVLFHDSCADGFGSAWSAWESLGDAASYIPVQYGQPPPDIPDGSTVYILDFSYDRATLEALAGRTTLRVLDHHKTAQADLAGLPFATFDMDKSGAVLAWEHFHPGKPVPLLLQYVQDRDLWQWELSGSRAINAGLGLVPRTFAEWKSWAAALDRPHDREAFHLLYERGQAILAAQSNHVSKLCDKAAFATIAGHRVPVVNSPLFQSEIGEELCRRHPESPFAASFFITAEGDAVYSLRSRNGFDVSAVAKSLGGGGHAAAAGFSLKGKMEIGA